MFPLSSAGTAYVPLDQTALRRLQTTLVVSCSWFPRPLVGSTYPRDHVKVARGLSSCALPQVGPCREDVSRREVIGRLTLNGEQGMGDSKVDVYGKTI